jgi:alpha-galactosidase
MIHRAMAKTGRPIVLSLSPGPTSAGVAKEVGQYAQMWRIPDEIWDYWKNVNPFPRSLYDQFQLTSLGALRSPRQLARRRHASPRLP